VSGQFCRGILIRVSIRKNEMLFSAGINRYTMFAPSNAAIDNMSPDTLETISNDTTNLRSKLF